jgi:hypothetical protein
MLQLEEKACFWERREDAPERGQWMVMGECRDAAGTG